MFTVNDEGSNVILGGVTSSFTVTLTEPLPVVYVAVSVGVKVTDCGVVPTLGTIDGEVNANVPATDAEPPLNTDEESSHPAGIAEAVGAIMITGIVLFTVRPALALVALAVPIDTTQS